MNVNIKRVKRVEADNSIKNIFPRSKCKQNHQASHQQTTTDHGGNSINNENGCSADACDHNSDCSATDNIDNHKKWLIGISQDVSMWPKDKIKSCFKHIHTLSQMTVYSTNRTTVLLVKDRRDNSSSSSNSSSNDNSNVNDNSSSNDNSNDNDKSNSKRNVVLKSQILRNNYFQPNQRLNTFIDMDKAFREYIILMHLNILSETNHCDNFIKMHECFIITLTGREYQRFAYLLSEKNDTISHPNNNNNNNNNNNTSNTNDDNIDMYSDIDILNDDSSWTIPSSSSLNLSYNSNKNNNNNDFENNKFDEITVYIEHFNEPNYVESSRPPDAEYHLLNFILEYADLNLIPRTVTMGNLKAILFQLMYALSVAREQFEFVHNDLHERNILLASLPPGKKYMVYHMPGTGTWIVGGAVVKLIDFGLSRLVSLYGDIIYNERNSSARSFSDNDMVAIMKLLNNIKIDEPKVSKDRQQLIDLRRRLCGASTKQLLNHPFFDSLKSHPPDLTQSNCIQYSFNGVLPPVFPKPSSSNSTHKRKKSVK